MPNNIPGIIPHSVKEYRTWWPENYPDIPYGYCQCGCGKLTPISICNDPRRPAFKGEPTRYARGHNDNTRKLRLRPEYKVEDRGYSSPCWIWQKFIIPNGYPQAKVNGRIMGAHRHYYEKKKGPIPAGMQPDHLCGIRACVNPDHLEAVTPTENVRRSRATKLTLGKVRRLRARAAGKGFIEKKKLAAEFGISWQHLYEIVANKRWRE